MTVASAVSRVEYTTSAGLLTYPYPFPIFAATDLQVYYDTTLLTLTTHYSVTSAGDPAGGNVVLVSDPGAAHLLVIERVLPITQGLDYVENDKFPAESHERGLDYRTMVEQMLYERDRKRPAFLPGSATRDWLFPDPVSYPNDGNPRYLRMNAAHTALEAVTQAADVSGVLDDTIPAVARGSLPAAGTPGRLRQVTDDVRGVWHDDGDVFVAANGGALPVGLKATGSSADRAFNTAKLQAAIDAAPAGAELVLPFAPTGREIHLGAFQISKALTLRGHGIEGTKLIASATTSWAIKVEAHYVNLVDFSLDGAGNANVQGSGNGVYGVWFNGYSHHLMERVRVTGFLGTSASDVTRGCGVVKEATANGGFFLTMRQAESKGNGHGLKTVYFLGPPQIPVTYCHLIDTVMTSNQRYGIWDSSGFTYGLLIFGGHYAFNASYAWALRPTQFAIIVPNLEDNNGGGIQATFTAPGDLTVFHGLVVGLSAAPTYIAYYPGTYASGGYYIINGTSMSTPESGTSNEPALQLRGNVDFAGLKYYLQNDAALGFFESGVFKALFGRSNTRQAVVGNTQANSSAVIQAPNDVRVDVDGTQVRLRGDAATHEIQLTTAGTKIKGEVGFFNATPAAKPTVTGSRGANAALQSLLSALAALGLLTDSSTA